LSEINGEKRANCDAGPDKLNELKNYYIKMTNERDGKRVFDRTMWYCSSENGWTLTGGNSAELFGLATHASDLNTFFGSTYTWLVQAINLKECDFPEEKTSLVQRAINGELEAYVFDFLSETTCRSTPCHSSCEILNYR
jgi:hypothetical protein